MEILESLKKGLESGDSDNDLARKFFLSYQTLIFKDQQDTEFSIKDRIKKELNIPFVSIQVTGSSKTGVSFFKKTKFTEGESDLDISIINLDLYNHFLEEVHKITNGFTDLSVFPEFKGKSTDKQFINNLKKGFINPFFMPDCEKKSKWLDFFREVSNDYFRLFKSINGAIYSSEYFFECKQAECIEEFKGNMKAYDSLPSKI
ncbi:hypothetical protein [Enterovibrio norvegicus]|uniref:hypothetical protein n=1 Tax=Enterovibrio norvegicus TaxID=188144 RepID=UPI000C868276|nr:hypothetical protein [Enterovibrio norvegicus]PMN65403.1 hypothetical protein BCT27_08255 [Enterovibrio norvegicus]